VLGRILKEVAAKPGTEDSEQLLTHLLALTMYQAEVPEPHQFPLLTMTIERVRFPTLSLSTLSVL
jgi:hypothetical protein